MKNWKVVVRKKDEKRGRALTNVVYKNNVAVEVWRQRPGLGVPAVFTQEAYALAVAKSVAQFKDVVAVKVVPV